MSQSLDKKIKVCQVVSVDITLKFMLLNQLRALRDQGYEVYATSSPGKWIKDIEKQGIKVKTIGFKRKMSPVSDLISFLKLFFYFKKEKFDVVHTHTFKPEIFGQIAAKLAGVPIVLNTLHGFDFSEKVSPLKKKIFGFLLTIVSKFSTKIFSISKNIIDGVIKERICSLEKLIYLGRDIDTNRFDPQKFDKNFIEGKKKELGIRPGSKVLGIVARLVAEKGILELFSAAKEIIKEYPETIFLIVGPKEPDKKDGINPEIIKNYGIEKNVVFVEDQEKVEEFYAIMDMFVLPTHREGLGASTLEASAMEKPVIVSDTGGCPEAVDDGVTGMLIPIKDIEKLKEAIIFMFENKERAEAMGKAGREKILREFKKEIVLDRLKKSYQELIEKIETK